MGIGDIFTVLLTQPITNGMLLFYVFFKSIGIPFALGFSIISLTILLRILLYPFISSQIKSAHAMQKIAPHISDLRKKHKGDKKRQQEEMMKLYKDHGVNPAAGCLPLIIQLPIIWSLYRVLIEVVSGDKAEVLSHLNELAYFPFLHLSEQLNTNFFGFDLAASPSSDLAMAPYLILVPLLTGIFQFVLSKMMVSPNLGKSGGKDDFQTTFQKQSVYIFPIMIGFFSFTLPVGLSLYWNTFTLFGILQQYRLVGWGGAQVYIDKLRANNK